MIMKPMLKPLTLAIFGLCLAASSFAFVEEHPAGGKKFVPEQSQEQLGQQQGFNGQYGVVGDEQINAPGVQVNKQVGEKEAQGVIIGASPAASGAAVDALQEVQTNVEQKKPHSPTRTILWGVFFLVLGAFAVWAFRTYADKVVPEPPQKRNTKW